jgi:tetratricopeptide (TPR) repeat protein
MKIFLSVIFVAYFAFSPGVLPAQVRQDAAASYNAGRDLESRGRMDEAEVYYREAVRICNEEIAQKRSNLDTYTVLTWTLSRQRRYAEVIRYGETGLKLGPDIRINETMGEAYFYLGNYEASLMQLQRYVNAMPQGGRSSVAYFFIGEIYRLEEKNYLADIAYTTAIHVEGGNVALWWYRLGSVREASGEYVLAIEAYERALRLSPGGYRQASEGIERSRRFRG